MRINQFVSISLFLLTSIIEKGYYLNNVKNQILLDFHNLWRTKFTRDTYGNQPTAADMNALEWNEELAKTAQRLTAQCENPMSFVTLNKTGIVSFSKSAGSKESLIDYLKRTFNLWISKSMKLGNNCDLISTECSNLKQVLYSRNEKVGCASNLCPKSKARRFVCIYNVKYTSSQPVFQIGEACSFCQENQPFCLDGSLCATKNQCTGENVYSDCRCAITQKTCQPNLIFQPGSCSCQCKHGYYGKNCQDKCQDKWQNCNDMKHLCQTTGIQKHFMFRNCPRTCQFCQLRSSSTIIPMQILSSNSSPKIKNEPEPCLLLKHLCTDPFISSTCEKTCKSSKSSILMPPESIAMAENVEPEQCSLIEELCANPCIAEMCKKTCGSSTSRIPTKFRPATLFPLNTESNHCKKMKDHCSNVFVAAICQKTCGIVNRRENLSYFDNINSKTPTILAPSASMTSATSLSPTLSILSIPPTSSMASPIICKILSGFSVLLVEPKQCLQLKDLCTNVAVAATCVKTCALLTSSRSTKPITTFSTMPTTGLRSRSNPLYKL